MAKLTIEGLTLFIIYEMLLILSVNDIHRQ